MLRTTTRETTRRLRHDGDGYRRRWGGLNTRDSLNLMPPTDAVRLDNWNRGSARSRCARDTGRS